MIRSVIHYENRISRLKTSGEMKNINLIKKAQRQCSVAIRKGWAEKDAQDYWGLHALKNNLLNDNII